MLTRHCVLYPLPNTVHTIFSLFVLAGVPSYRPLVCCICTDSSTKILLSSLSLVACAVPLQCASWMHTLHLAYKTCPIKSTPSTFHVNSQGAQMMGCREDVATTNNMQFPHIERVNIISTARRQHNLGPTCKHCYCTKTLMYFERGNQEFYISAAVVKTLLRVQGIHS